MSTTQGKKFKDREVYNVRLVRKGKLVGFSLLRRAPRVEVVHEFSMHEVEVRQLCERLVALLGREDGAVAMVEGAYDGALPEDDELEP